MAKEIGPLRDLLDTITDRKEEVIESADIKIKYSGYIKREQIIADKITRLEDISIKDRFNYNEIQSLSTEARHKLTRINPETIAQAGRIPGFHPMTYLYFWFCLADKSYGCSTWNNTKLLIN